MKNYIVTYTTAANNAARKTERVAALDYTGAYLKFTFDSPRDYIIIDLQEV